MLGRGKGARACAAVLAVAACAATAALGSASVARGSAADRGAPLKDKWTRHARTYQNGRKDVTVVYGSPVNYRDSSGEWQPIDDTLVPSAAAGYAYENRADAYKVRFPADLSSEPVQLQLGNDSIGFALRGAHGHGAVHGPTARFAGALPQTDVSYTATGAGARELLTLNSPDAPRSFTYDLQLGGGVKAEQLGPRVVAFVKANRPVAYFVAPAMRDAAGATSSALTVSLAGDSVTVTPDRAWLDSAARAYPVTVDPDVLIFEGAAQDTYIESGAPDSYFAGDPLLRVGYDGTQAIRGLLNYDLDVNLPYGVTVDNAQLALYLESATSSAATPVSVYSVLDPWSYVTWQRYEWSYQHNAPLLWNTPGGDVDGAAVSTATVAPTPGATTTWDVTQLVQREVSGLTSPYGFLLKQDGEATSQALGFASSYSYDGNPQPTLTVTWEQPNTTGPAASIVTGSGEMFGSVPVGTTTPTQEVDIQNNGAAPLTVSSLALAGANPGDFKIVSTTCTSAPIPQWGFCKITLSATPTAAGNRWGTLVIADNAPTSPEHVALQVNATAAAPAPPAAAASVTPASLSFGSVRVGVTSATQWVTVQSTGGATLSISKVARTGTNPGDFSTVSDSCSGKHLAPGASCTIGVRAKPKAKGLRTATLRIADNDPSGGQSVSLSVTGY